MTLTLRDLSDYDPDPVSFAGLSGVTHKATEGTMPHSAAEGTKLAARLNAAKAAGVPVLGSYHVLRTPGNGGAGSLPQQLAYWVARLDNQVPWWRSWPHWVWQIDAEKWSYDPDLPPNVLAFAHLLATSGLPGWKVTYASRGQYGDSLTGIPTALWNADYRGNGVYLGDAWVAGDKGQPEGWAPYSGQTPALLQWNGGPDLNAFRGSVDQLLTLTEGDPVAFMDDPNAAALAYRVDALRAGAKNVQAGPYGPQTVNGVTTPGETVWLVAAVEDIQAKLAALATPTVDTHALATDLVTQLQAAGLLTADGAHAVIKAVLDSALTAAAQAG